MKILNGKQTLDLDICRVLHNFHFPSFFLKTATTELLSHYLGQLYRPYLVIVFDQNPNIGLIALKAINRQDPQVD